MWSNPHLQHSCLLWFLKSKNKNNNIKHQKLGVERKGKKVWSGRWKWRWKRRKSFFSSLNFQQCDTLSSHPLSPSCCQGREGVTTWREKKSLRVFLAFFSSSKMEWEPVPLCCPLCSCSLFPLSASTSFTRAHPTPSSHPLHSCSPCDAIIASWCTASPGQTGALHSVIFVVYSFPLNVFQIDTTAVLPSTTIKLTVSGEFLETVDLLLGTG